MTKRFFEIDFLKTVLMLGLVFRHAPLYLYSGTVKEYSIDNFDIFTAFIPVTSGFIFILGYTLGLSYVHKIKNNLDVSPNIRHLKMFLFLLSLSVLFASLTYFINKIDISFGSYYIGYIWNTANKPGFYILLPISILFLINYCQYFIKNRHFSGVLIVLCLFLINIVDLYVLHYLAFGLIGYFIGTILDFLKFKSRMSVTVFAFAIFLYIGPFLVDYNINFNFIVEVYYLLLFVIITIFLGKVSLFQGNIISNLIISTSRNILPFYLIHVIGLNIIHNVVQFDSFIGITAFSILYFIIIVYFISVTKVLFKNE
jgi:hypothetical protein